MDLVKILFSENHLLKRKKKLKEVIGFFQITLETDSFNCAE